MGGSDRGRPAAEEGEGARSLRGHLSQFGGIGAMGTCGESTDRLRCLQGKPPIGWNL